MYAQLLSELSTGGERARAFELGVQVLLVATLIRLEHDRGRLVQSLVRQKK